MIHWTLPLAIYLWAGYWLACTSMVQIPGEPVHPTWARIATAVVFMLTWAVLFPVVVRRKEQEAKKGK